MKIKSPLRRRLFLIAVNVKRGIRPEHGLSLVVKNSSTLLRRCRNNISIYEVALYQTIKFIFEDKV
jgi:hypothetical protein